MMSFHGNGKRMVENLRAIRVVKAFGAENSTWLEIDEVATGATMAAISANVEHMQHCVVKYWARISKRLSFWYSPS